ncbi:10 TM acyl transferase domain found in Cas1p-domain-containing protein [Cunninghamella echinulata]|nr:10 TM acyl transferase domain found in Cas1p-domain-containing protein [Cunninghamella echinulata]
MQLIILVYHFTGASGTAGIYDAVRSLVAAYLFQTGYGHFFFFYKKKDFGMKRFLNVMIRLNLLTFVLMYLMNTDYLSYYFTPLVSLWFIIIWLTMYIGHSYNQKVWFMLLKMFIACCFSTALIHTPGILEALFDILSFVANIHWKAAEWRFRLALDAYIVYIGMLFAFATIKFNEHKIHERAYYPPAKWISVGLSAIGMVWYFWFELSQPNKQTYNAKHPYVSWIPILSFIVLRNCTLFLRNINSGFFMWIGKCSLETFIGQFHMWLAADTKGLLIVLPSTWIQSSPTSPYYNWGWWLNFIISSIVFLYICHYLSQTTGTLTQWLCEWFTYSPTAESSTTATTRNNNNNNEHLVREDDYQAVPLLPTHSEDKLNDDDDVEGKGLMDKDEDDDLLSLEEEMNSWQQTNQPLWKRWGSKVWYDARLKSALFVLFMTIINHLC